MNKENVPTENGAAGFPLETIVMPLIDEPIDYWNADDFEDNVAAALISCYETRLEKNKGCMPQDRLRNEHLRAFRRIGPYVPSNSRKILFNDGNFGYFDFENDPLPEYGCLSFTMGGRVANDRNKYSGYIHNFYIKKAKALGKNWNRRGGGQLYVMFVLVMQHDGRVAGERRYFSVGSEGVVACVQRVKNVRGYTPGVIQKELETEPEILQETTNNASFALQYIADRRFSWVITAKEQKAKAHLGCMIEEVKSLLYARDLPLTTTGRKRPILHLVAAHKRRMKSGTDIDVSSFLRGSQTVRIGGTEFTVRPPAMMKDDMPASQRFFGHNDHIQRTGLFPFRWNKLLGCVTGTQNKGELL